MTYKFIPSAASGHDRKVWRNFFNTRLSNVSLGDVTEERAFVQDIFRCMNATYYFDINETVIVVEFDTEEDFMMFKLKWS